MALNKLTIYLIKENYKKESQILKSLSTPIQFSSGNFYTEDSNSNEPSWVKNFFNGQLGVAKLFVASAKGVLLVKVLCSGKKVIFALSFGVGRHMLREDAIEEGFGLKVTLNSVEPDSIRSIEKSNIGANSKISKEQMSRSTNALSFGIDIEQDLLRTVTGRSRYEMLGNTISGGDSLGISIDKDVETIKKVLVFCYDRYLSKDYLKNFEWVDQIHHVKDPVLVSALEAMMLKYYNGQMFDKLWMAIPDLLDWDSISGFKYIPGQVFLEDDVSIEDFYKVVGNQETVQQFRNKTVTVYRNDGVSEITHWNVFKCLYGEFVYSKKHYILNNGKWYEINEDFVSSVNASYEKIKLSRIILPDYDHENEGDYNKFASTSNSQFLLMDKRNVMHGGGSNKIEFCDIYTKAKQAVHVKHYGASAVLSHLFQQGMNAAEYLNSDSAFRMKLNAKLENGWKLKKPENAINAEEFEIVFAIISRKENPRPSIPFFSKVSLKNVTRRLHGYRFKVSLLRIKSLRAEDPKADK